MSEEKCTLGAVPWCLGSNIVRNTTTSRFLPGVCAILLTLAAAPAFADTFACAGDSIRVFADDAGLGSQPIRTITGPTAGVAECYAIALDNLHNELWVTTQATIRAFPARATGDVAPLRTIGGSGLFAVGIALDVEAGEVYVGTPGGGILVFARTGDGTPAPLRAIQGDKTTLSTVIGLFVDRVNNELYAVNYQGSIAVFDRLADGNAAPLRPLANATNPVGIVVDAHGNEVFIATGAGSVLTYNRNGSALRTLSGVGTGLAQASGLALRRDGNLLVGNQYHSATTTDAIFGFPRTQNGDASPVIDINFAAPPQSVLWGIASSQAFECNEGQTTSYCLFHSGFE
jgi:hypothetical protein